MLGFLLLLLGLTSQCETLALRAEQAVQSYDRRPTAENLARVEATRTALVKGQCGIAVPVTRAEIAAGVCTMSHGF
jgi:hypothetical protein